MDEIDRLAKIIWDYHQMNQPLKKADVILVLGSHDTRVAERGAELFMQGYAPLLIMSGGQGRLTKTWTEPEADKFKKIAVDMGVPEDKILIENKSANTGENIEFTKLMLKDKGLSPQSFIVVQKPYMERRSYATFKKRWPGKDIVVTSPQIPFEQYPTEIRPKDELINIMVGDLQRIKEYPALGYQIPQDIPPEVSEAYNKLIALGFTGHLI